MNANFAPAGVAVGGHGHEAHASGGLDLPHPSHHLHRAGHPVPATVCRLPPFVNRTVREPRQRGDRNPTKARQDGGAMPRLDGTPGGEEKEEGDRREWKSGRGEGGAGREGQGQSRHGREPSAQLVSGSEFAERGAGVFGVSPSKRLV